MAPRSKLAAISLVLLAALTMTEGSAAAQFEIDEEGLLRRVIAESFVQISGSGESAEDSDAQTSETSGSFAAFVTAAIDELGFSTEASADQISLIAANRIYGVGSAGFFFGPAPPDGLVSCAGVSDMVVTFAIDEPVEVAYDANVQDNPVRPASATSVAFAGPGGFSVAVSATAPGINSTSFVVVLEPGVYSIEASADVDATDEASPDAPVSAIGSWSFDLRPVEACPEDLTNDGEVSSDDLFQLLSDWGAADAPSDFNGDGAVDSDDLFQLLSAWGPCPT